MRTLIHAEARACVDVSCGPAPHLQPRPPCRASSGVGGRPLRDHHVEPLHTRGKVKREEERPSRTHLQAPVRMRGEDGPPAGLAGTSPPREPKHLLLDPLPRQSSVSGAAFLPTIHYGVASYTTSQHLIPSLKQFMKFSLCRDFSPLDRTVRVLISTVTKAPFLPCSFTLNET